MKLLTEELKKVFEKYPIGSQDGKGGDAKVIAKFFNPYGSQTWLITEAQLDGEGTELEDWILFGFCNLGDIQLAELGYVSLNELQNLEIEVHIPLTRDTFKGKIERDLYFPKDITLREACEMEFGYVPDSLRVEKIDKTEVNEDFTRLHN